ncbi:hypothetical protein Tco_0925543 [Tanacetum coccineum]|uniref:Uncharacterized protein n=1 Tax=Tanacetum coccineum TaxID=301880 RepID=A0ABQ5DE74_9ASTR
MPCRLRRFYASQYYHCQRHQQHLEKSPGQVFFLEMELVSAKDAQLQALSGRIGTMAGEKLCGFLLVQT